MDAPNQLAEGTRFASRNGLRGGTVGRLLGAGGQGAVYHATLDGHPFALKWYHDHYVDIDTGLYERLARAVDRGAPDNRFLWPLELVHVPGQRSFGYVMPLRTADFVGMRDLIAPPPKRVELTLPQRATVCAHIAHCFLELHARGFCYQDINFGNVFLNPDTANVLICDNDNVNVDGAPASIYGTRKFMAPEVVRREVLPSTRTDLFSMAVMFFYVVFGWHPLDGRREASIRILDTAAENRLYGTEPVFLFDPVNTVNGPLEGMHDAIVYRWHSLTAELRGLFTRSFTVGLFAPNERVHEYEWRQAFAALPARIFQCAACGYENAIDREPNGALAPRACASCGRPPGTPIALACGRRLVAMRVGGVLTSRQIGDGPGDERIAMVQAHPTEAGVFGLLNVSQSTWRAEVPGYSATPIPPGKTIRLLDGLKLEIDGAVLRAIAPPAPAAPA